MRYGFRGRIAAAARAVALSSLFVGAHVAPSWAWGDLGHKIICEIAVSRVKPATRSEIDKLMQTDTEFSSFSDACVWPDHPRKRASEHFLNLPRDSHGLTENDCGGATACVVTAIAKDAAVLSASSSTAAEKLTSLKYLGHWIGDVHQPLHVSFEDDRGGNNIKVSGMCSGNLHSVWDTCLVTNAVGSDAAAAAGRAVGLRLRRRHGREDQGYAAATGEEDTADRCLTRRVKALALFATAGVPGEVLLTSPIGRTASSATIRLNVETIASSSPMVIRFMH